MTQAHLTDRGVLAISGDDSREFLQGLITNDIRKASAEHALFAALLSPQGRFLHDFFIIEREGKLLLETQKDRIGDLIKRLKMYRLRSKVEFTEVPQLQVAAVWGEESDKWQVASGSIMYADPRLPELGSRILLPEVPTFVGTPGDYDRHRISLGVPEGAKDLIVDRSILLEYGYDELHAIDFAKGCYVGQEVTARSKHRATLRKFIHKVHSFTPLPPVDSKILWAEREVGIMRSSTSDIGLALLQVSEVQRATEADLPLHCGETIISCELPAWCATAFEHDSK
jgi:folate-binding protein YgfZ